MGVLSGMKSVSDENAVLILNNPELVLNLADPDDPVFQLTETRQGTGFFSKLFGRKKNELPNRPQPMEGLKQQDFIEIDLGKVWHGLHYCLTGDVGEGEHALGFIMYGGTQIGDIDLGYGPGRLFTSHDVKELNRALANTSVDTLKSNFDPNQMDDVYLSVWQEDGAFEYILEYYERTKSYLKNLSKKELGMVVYFY